MLEKIEAVLGAKGKPWTEGATLPGGDFDRNGFGGLVSRLRTEKPWLPGALAERLMRLYGTKAFVVVKSAGSLADLGRVFGGDLTEAEVNYLMDQEWAVDAEDVLWRRTKLGLTLDADSVTALEAYMQDRRSTRAAAQ